MSDERSEEGIESTGLLGLLADIRAAVGDPTGKLMQDELVEHCRKLAHSADCPECGEVWDASADTLPTPAQLHRWARLYWVDTAKAQEIEKGLGICFAQEIRAIADVIEDRILSPNAEPTHFASNA